MFRPISAIIRFYTTSFLKSVIYMFLTEFTPSYSLTQNGDDAPQN